MENHESLETRTEFIPGQASSNRSNRYGDHQFRDEAEIDESPEAPAKPEAWDQSIAAPSTERDTAEDLEEEDTPEQQAKRSYQNLLHKYGGAFRDIKQLRRQYRGMEKDPEVRSATLVIDRERHDIHEQLKREGRKLGKTENEVLADIILQEENLGEYGLPELGVISAHDLWLGGDERPFDDDHIGIVYGVNSTLWIDSIYERAVILEPKDAALRRERAKNLAKALKADFNTFSDGNSFHSVTTSYNMVVVPKDKLQKAVDLIRSDPTKYRIGEQFYSEKQKRQMESDFKEEIERDLQYIDCVVKDEKERAEVRDWLLFRVKQEENRSEYGLYGLLDKEARGNQ